MRARQVRSSYLNGIYAVVRTIARTATLLGACQAFSCPAPAPIAPARNVVRAGGCARLRRRDQADEDRTRRGARSDGARSRRRPVVLRQARTGRASTVVVDLAAHRGRTRCIWRRVGQARRGRDRAIKAADARKVVARTRVAALALSSLPLAQRQLALKRVVAGSLRPSPDADRI